MIAKAFMRVVDLGVARGMADIAKTPGCQQLDFGMWALSLNPHLEPTKNADGVEVPMGSVFVQYNGWPAGIIGMDGGCLVGVTEDQFIEAIEAQIETEGGTLSQ